MTYFITYPARWKAGELPAQPENLSTIVQNEDYWCRRFTAAWQKYKHPPRPSNLRYYRDYCRHALKCIRQWRTKYNEWCKTH